MNSLAPQADQAVRHAVDAYIDGRLLPALEGDASFETRNSSYRLVDGVLFSAPDQASLGAEFVGWLVEYVSRAEVVSQWKPGARAILVDTRNDGVTGPHIIITSATKTYRSARSPSQPNMRLTPPQPFAEFTTGSSLPHVGSFAAHGTGTLPPPPFPTSTQEHRPWNAYASATTSSHHVSDNHVPTAPATLPPPPPLPTFRPRETPQTIGQVGGGAAPSLPPPMMVHESRRSLAPPPPLPRPLPRALPPHPHLFADEVAVRNVAAAYESSFVTTEDWDDGAPTVRNEKQHHVGAWPSSAHPSRGDFPSTSSRLTQGRAARAPMPPASVPFLLSQKAAGTRAPGHQRGLPLR